MLISKIYDLSEEVICRCGSEVLISIIPDQWFINYADPEVKTGSKQHTTQMSIWPKSYAGNIGTIIDWFRERPCARKGRWLGTPLPFDREWIIEPISDSTLYPAFYTINHILKEAKITPDQMTLELFDYIFHASGDPHKIGEEIGADPEWIMKAREEFDYWYPVDLNIGGKEHQTVHFPAYIMNHTALLNQVKWPKGILSNWYIVMGGGKISKSKGGAVPIPDLAKRFTADGMRLYYSNIASPFVDVEWNAETAKEYRNQIDRTLQTIKDLLQYRKTKTEMDQWIKNKLAKAAQDTQQYLESMDFRKASGEVFYQIPRDIRWYLRRGGGEQTTIRYILDSWIRLMSPFTPHLAEETWQLLGHKELVSQTTYPTPTTDKIAEMIEKKEDYLQQLIGDIARTIKATKMTPSQIMIYTAEKGPFDECKYLKTCRKFLEEETNTKIQIHQANDSNAPDPGNKKDKAKTLRPAIWLK